MLGNVSEEDIEKFQSLKRVIEDLQKRITLHSDYLSEKETRTRQFLIDPLLGELDWDVLNPNAVQLEYGVKDRGGTKQLDYALMLEDCPIAVVQAKSLNSKQKFASEAKRTKNIRDRTGLTNIHYIIVTDGNRWLIYEAFEVEVCLIMEFELHNESSDVMALRVLQIWKLMSNLAALPASALAIKKDDNIPVPKLYLEYWKALKNHFEQRDNRNDDIKFRKPQSQCWMGFAVGRSGFLVHTWASRDKEYICVGLTVDGTHGRSHFDRLKMSKADIEREIGAELKWQPNPKENNIRLYRWNTDLENTDDWKCQHTWFCEQLEIFHRVFSRRVKALPK